MEARAVDSILAKVIATLERETEQPIQADTDLEVLDLDSLEYLDALIEVLADFPDMEVSILQNVHTPREIAAAIKAAL